MSSNNGNIFIQIKPFGERQENIISQRNTLKSLKNDVGAASKENFVGATKLIDKLTISHHKVVSNESNAIKKIDAQTQSEHIVITNSITAADLTSTNEPNEFYYKRLAEHRRKALECSLLENKHLNDRIESLEEELDTSRKELDEAMNLTEILKEMLTENEEDADQIDRNHNETDNYIADH